MRRLFSLLALVLCLLPAGCGGTAVPSPPAELTAAEALDALESHLLEAELVSPGLTGAAGEPLEWEKALTEQDTGDYTEADAPAAAETEIDGTPAWQALLRYGTNAGAPMAGRRYGDYAIAKDGSACWMWNIAASRWDPI